MPEPLPQLAVSTWSLHRRLGLTWWDRPGLDGPPDAAETYGPGEIDLLDLPAEVRAHGIERLEICHFHLKTRDPVYLGEVRTSLAAAGVALQSLLIDDGDVSDPENGARDLAWVRGWIDAAAELGAVQTRVIAGKRKATPELLDRSVAGLSAALRHGQSARVPLITENWHDLLSGPDEVAYVLDHVGAGLGFLADTGNWKAPTKYAGLATIFRRADYCHAHGPFDAALALDEAEFGRCLDIAVEAGFTGPYTLIYSGPSDQEWAALDIQREFVRRHLAAKAAA